MPSAALLPLLCLLAQTPATSEPGAEPSPQREAHVELLVTPLGVGGALERSSGGQPSLVAEAGAGLQLGLAFGQGRRTSRSSSPLFSNLGASLGHAALGVRARLGAGASVDVGVRVAALFLSTRNDPATAGFVGLYLRPSFGSAAVRYSFTVAAGPLLGSDWGDSMAVLVMPFTLAFF
jgi:hypothetical protein